MSSIGRDTNKFPTDFSFQCFSVQSCVAEFQHQIRQNGLWKKKKRQQTTTLGAAAATVYERKIDAGDAF